MSVIDFISPGTRIGGPDEDITDCAFDLGKKHLATSSSKGIISIFKRPERQDEWREEHKWELEGKPPLSKVDSPYLVHNTLTSSRCHMAPCPGHRLSDDILRNGSAHLCFLPNQKPGHCCVSMQQDCCHRKRFLAGLLEQPCVWRTSGCWRQCWDNHTVGTRATAVVTDS